MDTLATASIRTAKVREKIRILYKRIERYKWSKKLRIKYSGQLLTLEKTLKTCVVKDAETWIEKMEQSLKSTTSLPLAIANSTVEWQPRIGLRIRELFGKRQGTIVEVSQLNQANLGLSEIKVQYDDGQFDTPYPNQLIALEPNPIESAPAKVKTPLTTDSMNIPQPAPQKESVQPAPAPQPLEPAIAEPDLSWDVRIHREVSLNGRKAIITKIVSQPSPRSGATEVAIRYSDNYQDEVCFAWELTRLSPPAIKKEEPRKLKLSSVDFKEGTEIYKAWIAREEVATEVNAIEFRGNRINYRDRYKHNRELVGMGEAINWVEQVTGYYAKLDSFVAKAQKQQEFDEYAPTVVVRRIMTSTRGNFFAIMVGEKNEDIVFMTSFPGELNEVVDRLVKAKVGVIIEDGEIKIAGSRRKLEAFARKAEHRQENDEYPPTVIIRQLKTAQALYFAFAIGATNEEIFVTPFAEERDRVICRLTKARVGVIIEQDGERYRPKITPDGKIEATLIPVGQQPKRA